MKINPGGHNFQIVFRSTCHSQALFLCRTLGEQIHFIAPSQQKILVCPKEQCFGRKVDNHIFTSIRGCLCELLLESSYLKVKDLHAVLSFHRPPKKKMSPASHRPHKHRCVFMNFSQENTPYILLGKLN